MSSLEKTAQAVYATAIIALWVMLAVAFAAFVVFLIVAVAFG